MDVVVNGRVVRALLDTGATVSVISRAAVTELGLPVLPVNDLIQVECANGQTLPYEGYVTLAVSIPHNPASTCLALVTPDRHGPGAVQLILGTNILTSLLPASGKIPEPLRLVAQCLKARDAELAAAGGSLAFIQLAGQGPVCLEANRSVAVPVRLDRALPYHQTHALVESSMDSVLPDGIEVSPSLCVYSRGRMDTSEIVLSNCSDSAVRLEAGALVAQLTPVVVTNSIPLNHKQTDSAITPDLTSSALQNHHQEKLRNLVTEYTDVMARDELDLGHYRGVEHTIELDDPKPFKQRYRRIPPHMFEEVRDHLRQLEVEGVIRPSKSQYSSPVVCCCKKDGKLRLCVDYRLLNSRTRKDNYCLPRVDEILDSLRGAKYFSRLDLKSGYHQISIKEEHKPYTAFTVGPLGFWEHNRLAFGLCNSPGTFQRVMEDCFSDLNLRIMYIYIDDIIIFSETEEDHLERLQLVFQRLRDCGLKLSVGKCAFAQSQVSFLGHLISAEGVRPDPDKIEKVKDWSAPRNPKELRSFLGFAGYYRKFVENYSGIARPLNSLLPPTCKKGDKVPSRTVKWEWETKHERSFQCLKDHLCSAPLLAYADFTKPFELHIDASTVGLGAVLYQAIDGEKKVIAYASRALTKSEERYPAHKLEFLCLKWSVCDKFNDYLWGAPKFLVRTDNNPLTYVLTSAKLDATGHRWLAALASFDFEIEYTPGVSNQDADDIASVQAMCSVDFAPFAATMAIFADNSEEDASPFPHISLSEIRKAQNEDEVLGVWMTVKRKRKCPVLKHTSNPAKHGIMKRNWHRFFFQRGLLHRKVEGEKPQLVLPAKYIPKVCRALHNDMGHQGCEKTMSLIRSRFFWPGMSKDVDNWIHQCGRCLRFKGKPDRAPLVGIQTSEPLELVCTDFLKVDAAQNGTQYILVITDHFTRFSMAVPTCNMSARTTAEALLTFVRNFGIPKRLHADQGANFESKVTGELCHLLGVEKSRTTPFHPMGNGSCERMNQTLINMLGTLPECRKRDWPAHIGMLVLAYNSTRHDSTGFSPYFLMFGREPRLPVDNMFPLTAEPRGDYVSNVKQALEWAWAKATDNSAKAKESQKKYYDKRVRGATLKVGD